MARVLIIDDAPDLCHGLSRIVRHAGRESITSGTLAEGVAAAQSKAVLMARHDSTLYPVHLPGKIRVEVAQAALSTPCARPAEMDTDVFQPNASQGRTLQEFREMACAHAGEQYLKDVLAASQGNIKQVLRLSGLSQSRLYALLKKYHLTPAM